MRLADTVRPEIGTAPIARAAVAFLLVGLCSCGGGGSSSASLVSIQLTPVSAQVIRGETQQFTAVGIYSDHSMQDLTTAVLWASSVPATASISKTAGSSGLVTAENPGATTISATLGDVSGRTLLTVVPRPEVLYVTTESATYQYSIEDTGELHPLTPASIQEGLFDIKIDRSGRHAYGISGLNVAQFAIAPNGALTPMTPSSVNAGIRNYNAPVSIVLHPNGQFAYVTVPGEPGAGDGGILRFEIGNDGALQSPPITVVGGNPVVLAFDPKGLHAYVAYYGDYTGDSSIDEYTVTPDGSLTGTQFFPAGTEVRSIVTDPAGLHLYVAARTSNRVLQYDIADDGSLMQLDPSSVSMMLPGAIAVHPDGMYLYVGTDNGLLQAGNVGSVSLFKINNDGTLAAMNPPTVASGTDPIDLVIEPSGRFVYTANYQDHSISEYAVAPDGALASIGSISIPAGEHPISIAATR